MSHPPIAPNRPVTPDLSDPRVATPDLITAAVDFLNQGVSQNAPVLLERAILCFDQAIVRSPSVEAHYGRAVAGIQLNQLASALTDLRAAASLAPGNADIQRLLAQVEASAPAAPQPAPAQPTPPTSTHTKLVLRAVGPFTLPGTPKLNPPPHDLSDVPHVPAYWVNGGDAGSSSPTAPPPSSAAPNSRTGLPKISILTPALNCAEHLRACIESVLAQNHANFEHIIIDGGSNDGTLAILKEYPHLRWASEPDSGPAEALNKALKLVTGDYVARLDAADYYLGATIFRDVLATFRASPNAGAVYGNSATVDADDTVVALRVPRANLDLRQLLHWQDDLRLSRSSIFYTRKATDTVGPFRQDAADALDLDYWLRVAAAGFEWVHLDATLSASRLGRSATQSAASLRDREDACAQVALPHVARLPRGQRFHYWKDFYLWRLQARQQTRIDAPSDPEALRGLCAALIQLKAHQPAVEVAQRLMQLHPTLPDGYLYAAEIFHAERRPTEAAHFSKLAFDHTGHHPKPAPSPKLQPRITINVSPLLAQTA